MRDELAAWMMSQPDETELPELDREELTRDEEIFLAGWRSSSRVNHDFDNLLYNRLYDRQFERF